jgi:hypothetical protein
LIKNIINFFFPPQEEFFEFYENRHYSNKELLGILENEELTVGQGNVVILTLLKRLDQNVNPNSYYE